MAATDPWLWQALGREPGLDAAELRSQAGDVEAALQRACQVPVPESDVDQSSVRGDTEGEGTAGAEEDEAVPEVEHKEPFLAVRGQWVSAKGECYVFEDHRTSRLTYEESLDNGCRLHGFLTKLEGIREDGVAMAWQAELAILDEEENPWYGPSFGEPPEPVGDIQVRYRPGLACQLETRIRVAGEDDDWQAPLTLRRRKKTPAPVADGAEGVFVFGAS
mmetsp:Transcript_13008/g.40206  ORF Transcript_13008/g.40206 Transcript_13008/m.40206 type:complete len:219 (+) Transcript_13008:54-710(+)